MPRGVEQTVPAAEPLSPNPIVRRAPHLGGRKPFRWPRKSPPKNAGPAPSPRPIRADQASGDTHIAELQRMSMAELIEEARKDNLTESSASRSRT